MKKTDWKYLVDVFMFLAMVGIILVGLLLAFVLKEGPAVKESEKIFLALHRHQWSHIHLYLSLAFTAFLTLHLILEWSWIKGKTQKLFKGSWRTALVVITATAVALPFVFWALDTKNDPEYLKFGFGQGAGRGRFANGRADSTALPQTRSQDRPQMTPAPSPEQAESPKKTRPQSKAVSTRPRRMAPDPAQTKAEESEEHEQKLVSGRLEDEQSQFVVTGQMTLRKVENATGIPAARILARLGLPSNVSRDETLGRLRRRFGFTLPEFRTAVEALMEKK
jgi:hypothetical protein